MRYGSILLAKVCDKLFALLDVLLLFGINLHNNTPTFRSIHLYYKNSEEIIEKKFLRMSPNFQVKEYKELLIKNILRDYCRM